MPSWELWFPLPVCSKSFLLRSRFCLALSHRNTFLFGPEFGDFFQGTAFGFRNEPCHRNDRQQGTGTEEPESTIRPQMLLHDGKGLVSQKSHQPKLGCGDRHYTPPPLRWVTPGNNNPTATS